MEEFQSSKVTLKQTGANSSIHDSRLERYKDIQVVLAHPQKKKTEAITEAVRQSQGNASAASSLLENHMHHVSSQEQESSAAQNQVLFSKSSNFESPLMGNPGSPNTLLSKNDVRSNEFQSNLILIKNEKGELSVISNP